MEPTSPSADGSPDEVNWWKVINDVLGLTMGLYCLWIVLPPAAKIEIKAKLSLLRPKPKVATDLSRLRFELFEIERATQEQLGAEVQRLARAS
jgi:hypothetical protein